MVNMVCSNEVVAMVKEASGNVRKSKDFINALLSYQLDSETFQCLLKCEENKKVKNFGYLLGVLKANVDTLPDKFADETSINGVSLDTFIKEAVDEKVFFPRQELKINLISLTDYWETYKSMSEIICGFGYTMTFSEERYFQFFPGQIGHFVSGFAGGYSDAFHAIATEANIKTTRTHPLHQDIWKNWMFFLKPDCFYYRLDGKYMFLYGSGYNSSGNRNVEIPDNEKNVNSEVYEELQNRSDDAFVTFDLNYLELDLL